MVENLLHPASSAALPDPNATAAAVADTTPLGTRPPGVPEKFWDPARGELRLDALLKSYTELERRLSARLVPPAPTAPPEEHARFRRAVGVPDSPADYAIVPQHPLVAPDPAVNARLHAGGFNPAQAQLVYDLAAEHLLPLLAEAAAGFEAERQRERLHTHFGGAEPFARLAPQIAAWGRANLPAPAFGALSTTHEGVVAMHGMMAGREPAVARRGTPPEAASEAELRGMMRDPRYWRARDPAFVGRVTEGFRRLVGG